jgi:hypothetical protein
MPPGPPGPLRTSVPDGADGHGSAGLPEISENRVQSVSQTGVARPELDINLNPGDPSH